MDSSKHPLISILLAALLEERAKVWLLAEALGIEPSELESPTMREGLHPYIEALRERAAVYARSRPGGHRLPAAAPC